MIFYMAGPYSSTDPDVRQQRFVEHCIAAAKLADLDIGAVFSPIALGHALCETGGLNRMDHEFWMRQCLPMLLGADVLIVLMIDGWEDSEGTQAEIQAAEEAGIPIYYWRGNDAASLVELIGC